jgi:hypothetical protein
MATPLSITSLLTPRPFNNYFLWLRSATSCLFQVVSLLRGLPSWKPSARLDAKRWRFRILPQSPLLDPFWIATWLPALQAHPLVWWVPPSLLWPLGGCACLQPLLPLLSVLTGPFMSPHPNVLIQMEALPLSVDRILAPIPPLGIPSMLMGGLSLALRELGGLHMARVSTSTGGNIFIL